MNNPHPFSVASLRYDHPLEQSEKVNKLEYCVVMSIPSAMIFLILEGILLWLVALGLVKTVNSIEMIVITMTWMVLFSYWIMFIFSYIILSCSERQ